MAWVTFNEELGYRNDCPTYESKADAEEDAAFKCRMHSVREVKSKDIEPCVPIEIDRNCLRCARCAATVEKRQAFIRANK